MALLRTIKWTLVILTILNAPLAKSSVRDSNEADSTELRPSSPQLSRKDILIATIERFNEKIRYRHQSLISCYKTSFEKVREMEKSLEQLQMQEQREALKGSVKEVLSKQFEAVLEEVNHLAKLSQNRPITQGVLSRLQGIPVPLEIFYHILSFLRPIGDLKTFEELSSVSPAYNTIVKEYWYNHPTVKPYVTEQGFRLWENEEGFCSFFDFREATATLSGTRHVWSDMFTGWEMDLPQNSNRFPYLCTLEIDEPCDRPYGFQVLALGLPLFPTLREIKLRGNTLSDDTSSFEGVEALRKVLPLLPHLKVLSISRPNLSSGGVQHLASLLASLPNLSELTIANITSPHPAEIIRTLASILPSLSLERLTLVDIGLDESMADLTPVFPFLLRLVSLSVVEPMGTESCWGPLRESLGTFPSLKSLEIGLNRHITVDIKAARQQYPAIFITRSCRESFEYYI